MQLLGAETSKGYLNGSPAEISWAVYSAELSAGQGEVQVSIYLCDSSGAPCSPIGNFVLFIRDFDTNWMRSFWRLYQSDQTFRMKSDAFYRIGQADQTFEKRPLKVPGQEQVIMVDPRLEHAIFVLNAQGFKTLRSNAGGADSSTLLEAESLPGELKDVALQAGFNVHSGVISSSIPFSQPLAAVSASQAFCSMLDDWSNGRLKPGVNYSDWQQQFRRCSLVPFPRNAIAKRKRSEAITQLILKSLKGQATFADFAGLRSGRDEYSRLPEGELLPLVGHKRRPASIADRDEAEARKILRWMCRGLSEGLALQKVAVEDILTERSRQKSKANEVNEANS